MAGLVLFFLAVRLDKIVRVRRDIVMMIDFIGFFSCFKDRKK